MPNSLLEARIAAIVSRAATEIVHAVRQAIAADVAGATTASVKRAPERLGVTHEKLRLVTGNFHDATAVDAAVKGHDAVIVTASATKLKAFKVNPQYFSQGTGYTVEAMKKHGGGRLVVLSALGVGESTRLLAAPLRLIMVDWLLKTAFTDHEKQEQQVRSSGLDWVIARPTRLTDGPAKKRCQATDALEKVPSSISRADVASFLVDACEDKKWVGKAVQLGG